MTASIRDDNPVVFFHHYLLTLEHGDVPEGEHVVPLGQANVVREGGDVTIVALGYMVGQALEAAEQLAAEGVSAEVIDPRTLAPLDIATILDVGREDRPARGRRPVDAARLGGGGDRGGGGVGGLLVAEGAGQLVCALDATIPYSEPMEQYLLPDAAKIAAAGARPGAGRRHRADDSHLLRADVADPRLRGAGRTADARERGPRPRPPLDRPGGGRGRRVLAAARRRRRLLRPPRARARAREGRADGARSWPS